MPKHQILSDAILEAQCGISRTVESLGDLTKALRKCADSFDADQLVQGCIAREAALAACNETQRRLAIIYRDINHHIELFPDP
jgi:hypothetical protein